MMARTTGSISSLFYVALSTISLFAKFLFKINHSAKVTICSEHVMASERDLVAASLTQMLPLLFMAKLFTKKECTSLDTVNQKIKLLKFFRYSLLEILHKCPLEYLQVQLVSLFMIPIHCNFYTCV